MSTAPIRNTRTTRGLLSCGISTPNALRLPPAAAPRIQTMPKIIRVWYILTSLPGRCHRTYLRMPLRRKSDKAGHSADRPPGPDGPDSGIGHPEADAGWLSPRAAVAARFQLARAYQDGPVSSG